MVQQSERVQISAYLDRGVRDRARATFLAVQGTAGAPTTFGGFVEAALVAYCTALEAQHHGGRPWPPHPDPLPWPKFGRKRM